MSEYIQALMRYLGISSRIPKPPPSDPNRVVCPKCQQKCDFEWAITDRRGRKEIIGVWMCGCRK